MMVKSSTAIVPLIGVLIALVVPFVSELFGVAVRVPSHDTCCGCDEDKSPLVRVDLHADSSAELDIDGRRIYVDAPRLSEVVRGSVADEVQAIYLNPDLNTSWQQVVEAISSLGHATGRKVALVTPAEPRYDFDW